MRKYHLLISRCLMQVLNWVCPSGDSCIDWKSLISEVYRNSCATLFKSRSRKRAKSKFSPSAECKRSAKKERGKTALYEPYSWMLSGKKHLISKSWVMVEILNLKRKKKTPNARDRIPRCLKEERSHHWNEDMVLKLKLSIWDLPNSSGKCSTQAMKWAVEKKGVYKYLKEKTITWGENLFHINCL